MNEHDEEQGGAPPFAGLMQAPRNEISATASAASAQMQVQAQYAIAKRFPRDMDQVRIAVLKDCRRPRFAEKARYKKPTGSKWNPATRQAEDQFAEGPSIRFAEAAARAFGNIHPTIVTLQDDDEKRVLHASVTDFESNLSWGKDFTVEKTVERSKLRTVWEGQGQERKQVAVPPLFTRSNTAGKAVYVYPTTDDELQQKEGRLASIIIRNLIVRVLPADLVEEAMEVVVETLTKKIKDDPEGERKRLIDAFAAIGITPAMLAEYLLKPVAGLDPAELLELRGIYQSLKDGELRWAELVAMKNVEPDADAGAKKKAEETAKKVKSAADKVKAKADEAKKQADAKRQGPAKDAPADEAPKAQAPPADAPAGAPRPGVDEPPADWTPQS
jgi:hypothetical protein